MMIVQGAQNIFTMGGRKADPAASLNTALIF